MKSNQELLEHEKKIRMNNYLSNRSKSKWQDYYIESDFILPIRSKIIARGDEDAWSRFMGEIYRYRIEVPVALVTTENGIKRQIEGEGIYRPHWYDTIDYMQRVPEEKAVTMENAELKEVSDE